ncbi:acetyl-CoA carboxylase biotin carboxyl carrier protein [bacterium]|nr:acetyl-CoA carboxylase biotin carboxyl carrier protein [bacterium]
MNEGKLRKLIELFQNSEINEIEVESSFWRGTRVRLSRGPTAVVAAPVPASPAPAPAAPAPAEAPAATGDDGLHEVLSPMVGTFYRSASPEAEPFVAEGTRVDNGQTVCIIEAMKIMNEIPADIAGEIVEILVDNAQPVEYNQPILKIRPS